MAEPVEGKSATPAANTAALTRANADTGTFPTAADAQEHANVPWVTPLSRDAANYMSTTGAQDLSKYPGFGNMSNDEIGYALQKGKMQQENIQQLAPKNGLAAPGATLIQQGLMALASSGQPGGHMPAQGADMSSRAPSEYYSWKPEGVPSKQSKTQPQPQPPSGDNRPSMGPGMYNGGLSKSENWNPPSLSNQYRPNSGDQGPMAKNVGPEQSGNIKDKLDKASAALDQGKGGWEKAMNILAGIADAFGVAGSAYGGINRPTMARQKYEQQLAIEQAKQGYQNKAQAEISKIDPQMEADIKTAWANAMAKSAGDIKTAEGIYQMELGKIRAQRNINVANASAGMPNVGNPQAAYQAAQAAGSTPGTGPEGSK